MDVSRKAGIVLLALTGALFAAAANAQTARTAGAGTPIPKDIDPESGNRLPLPRREDVDDDAKKIFDDMTRRSQRPLPRLYDPKLAKPMSEAAYYLKNQTGLPSRLLEIAVLTTARELDCQFEWTQWETDGRDPADPRHIEASIIDLIKYNKPANGLGEKETAVIRLGREMLGQKMVSAATFADVHRLFGPRLTVDLVNVMTGYAACTTEMTAFDQQLREGQQPLLPAGRTHPWKPVRPSTVAPPQGPLPADVYADSRNRLPLPKRENMDADGKAAFDELARAGADTTSVRLYDPKLAAPSGLAHHYVTHSTGLPDRLVAIAVLVTARERDSQYQWTQWETLARNPKDAHHLEPAIIDLIKYDKPAAGLGEKETAIINLVRAMFREEKVPSATFAEVLRLFGRRGTVHVVELVTLSSAEAAQLAAFGQQLPEGQTPLLPLR
ncbi:MAG: hypothetical protein ABUS56_11020 [Acidobacteriota bacterium]